MIPSEAHENSVRYVVDEPVRGSVPPPWFWALPGIERIEALARGYIEQTPLSRLMGIRPAHVGPGSGTWTMPTSDCLQGLHSELEISSFIEAALTGVAITTLRPGQRIEPITVHSDYFRPVRTQPGNLVARAHVVNTSRFFVYTECQIEDPQGRQIASARSHAEIRDVEPRPPAPPAELRRVESAQYATPDPYRRSYSRVLPSEDDIQRDGWLDTLRKQRDGGYVSPLATLLDFQFPGMDEGKLSALMPASEWLCMYSRSVSTGAILSILNGAAWFAAFTLQEPGKSFVGLSQCNRIYGSVPADGRKIRVEATAVISNHDMFTSHAICYDADGNVVAQHDGTGMAVDAAKRRKQTGPVAKRVLCTLLFTDIVGSTEQAERLGDTRWRALLDEHHAKVRADIARHQGTEIDTAGDGFFIRFDAPAQAIDCARAIVDSVKSLGIDLRAGVHTGECEVLGRNLSGMAVHIAARIQGQAGSGEILVSGTVKDLVVGSDTVFAPRGEHDLKGVPGTWSLHAVL